MRKAALYARFSSNNQRDESIDAQERAIRKYAEENDMNRWAARYGYKNSPKEILEDAKKGCNGRYACVNITNYHTIEFRMFRGTLKYNTLIATLELVDKICELATDLTDTELKSVSWSDFVGSLDDSTEPELITYLKERQLYINTPITAEEDD